MDRLYPPGRENRGFRRRGNFGRDSYTDFGTRPGLRDSMRRLRRDSITGFGISLLQRAIFSAMKSSAWTPTPRRACADRAGYRAEFNSPTTRPIATADAVEIATLGEKVVAGRTRGVTLPCGPIVNRARPIFGVRTEQKLAVCQITRISRTRAPEQIYRRVL